MAERWPKLEDRGDTPYITWEDGTGHPATLTEIALFAERDEAESALEAIVRDQVRRHRAPWRVESDWTEEVTAKDGWCVAKCSRREDADKLIEVAERVSRG